MFTDSAVKTYIYDNACKDCKNELICKWATPMMDDIVEKTRSIDKGLSPIRVVIQCGSFERKSNGFIPGQRN